MKKPFVVLTILVLLATVGFGGYTWHRVAERRAAWRAARPTMPSVADRSEAFRTRLADADRRVASLPPDVAALGELAQLYDANGYFAEAETAYRALLRFDPTNPHWPHLLGTLLAGYGRLGEALPLLERAAELAPNYAPARLHLADALLKDGHVDAAEAAYRELLRIAPGDPYGLLGLARVDLARDRLTAAREKLSRATAEDPTFFGAQSLLATVFEQLGDDEAANNARARANQAGRFKEAPDPWRDAVLDYCYDVYRLQVAAATAKSTGSTPAAIPLLERARALAPDDTRTLRQLGECYLDLHDLAHARDPLQHALAIAPTDAEVRVDWSTYLQATGDVESARENLVEALRVCSDPAPLEAELGGVLLRLHRWPEAIPHLQKATRLSPEKPDIARDLIATLFQLGRRDEAATELNLALGRYPTYPPILILAARYRILLGDANEAGNLLRRAVHAGASPGDLARLGAEYQRAFGRQP